MLTPMPAIWRTFQEYWHLERQEGRRLWLALVHAQHTVPASWRHTLCFFDATDSPWRSLDTVATFLSTATSPQVVVGVLESLHEERRLTHAEMNYFIGKTLAKVNAAEQWV